MPQSRFTQEPDYFLILDGYRKQINQLLNHREIQAFGTPGLQKLIGKSELIKLGPSVEEGMGDLVLNNAPDDFFGDSPDLFQGDMDPGVAPPGLVSGQEV